MNLPSPRARILSGMQPSNDSLSLGNYIGALTQWVALQDSYDTLYMMADLHALTVNPDPEKLRTRTRTTLAQYLAGGVDPARSTLFVQSHVPQHTELAWVLSCQTAFGEMGRMTQFKDKSQKQGTEATTVGLFTYPVLMAADILIYDAALVPVGEDQRQHLEITRDLAERMNSRFGDDTFVVPQGHIVKAVAKIFDLQEPTAKMSKSSSPRGTIWLSDAPKAAAKKIRSAVTDDGTEIVFDPGNKPGVSNLLTIFSVLADKSIEELEAEYADKQYGNLKVDLGEVMADFLTGYQARVASYLDDPAELDRILAQGAAKARGIAAQTLERVYSRVGLLAPGSGA